MERQGIRNGVAYEVAAVSPTTVILKGPANVELSHEDAVQYLRLPYAMTYASVQGRETPGSLCLHDTANSHFTLRHLYVGLSRAKQAALVRVEH